MDPLRFSPMKYPVLAQLINSKLDYLSQIRYTHLESSDISNVHSKCKRFELRKLAVSYQFLTA